MSNKEYKKILGRDIKYYLLMVYIYCNPIYEKISSKRCEYISEINKTVSKIDRTYKMSKLYIPDEVCTLIGYLITILFLVFVFKFKNTFWFILIVLCLGALIGFLIKKILWKIIQRSKKDEVQKIIDDKDKLLVKVGKCNKSLSKVDSIIVKIKGIISKDLDSLNLDLDSEVCFFYILYLYILLDDVSFEEALDKVHGGISEASSLYDFNVPVKKDEKYKDYFARNIKEVGYGISDIYGFIDSLPSIRDYQKEIDRAFKEIGGKI